VTEQHLPDLFRTSADPLSPRLSAGRRTLWRVPVSDLQSICRSRHFPPHFPNLVSLFLTLSLTPHACFRKSRYGSVRPAGDHVSFAMYLSMYRGVRSLLRVNVRNATIRKRYTRCALAKTNLTLLYCYNTITRLSVLLDSCEFQAMIRGKTSRISTLNFCRE